MKSFSERKNFLEQPAFRFTNSLLYSLEESRKWFCPQNLLHFEDVSIKCPKQFLYYIEFICRRACYKKIQVSTYLLGWFLGLQNLESFWKIYWIYCGASFEIIFRQKQFPKVSYFWIL